MRFSSLLLALPLVGSVLAAPAKRAAASSAAAAVPSVSASASPASALSAIQKLQSTVSSVTSINASTVESDVKSVLTTVEGALSSALSDLGVKGVSANVNLSVRQDTASEASQILAQVVQVTNSLVKGISTDLLGNSELSTLLTQIDSDLGKVLAGVDQILTGVLSLVASLLGDLGLSGILSNVGSLLTPLSGLLSIL
ncbi:hypothetical protein EHS25_000369 [Saitozyma podzolica]|uniref:DUF6987 domain-containing protein n=1 Tax=Saitozyma podzolica TaxID=1890683 RepID=A0A427YW29_9TREE|nr:hypothetical protein EHS25_000369 [Saitozyma podzolica]